MRILLDTHILVHAHNASSHHQSTASEILSKALESKIQACILPQILYEFYAVVTNPRRVDQPLSPDEAIAICEDFWLCKEIDVIEPQTSTTSLVFSLTRENHLSGARIFDCIIAATAKEQGIKDIYTENVSDFEIYDFLNVINPFE
jgi:hypothetical protein